MTKAYNNVNLSHWGVSVCVCVYVWEIITFTVRVHITVILATIVHELNELAVISIYDEKAVKTIVVYLPILPPM